jgi:hypothetical protein
MLEILNDNVDPFEDQSESSSFSSANLSAELTHSALKEYILNHNGRVRYADLFNHFRDSIIDSSSGKFKENALRRS